VARIRTIKPEFWTDGKVINLSYAARLLFIGCWNFARCDNGHLDDDAVSLKLRILPADDVDAYKLLNELIEAGMIVRYTHEGRTFLKIKRFNEHQKIDTRWGSRCPYCSLKASPKLTETHLLSPQEGKGKEGKGKEGKGKITTLSSKLDSVKDVFVYWQQELKHPQSKLDKKREKAINARLQEGYSVDRIKQAIQGIKKIPHNMGQNDRNTIYDDIELICRSGANVDRFADARVKKPPGFNGIERYQRAMLTTELIPEGK